MGRWGLGNFDSDASCDWYLGELGQSLLRKIQAALADPVLLEPDESESEQIVAAIETLTALNRYVFPILPSPEEVAGWEEAILGAWDEYYDGKYGERREVIVKTLKAATRQARKNLPKSVRNPTKRAKKR